MDIYSTQSLASARVILNQFVAINISIYGEYNASTLNASQSAINQTLVAGYPTASGLSMGDARRVQCYSTPRHQRLRECKSKPTNCEWYGELKDHPCDVSRHTFVK
jgi:hypothetical protein